MRRRELVAAVARKAGITREQAKLVLDTVLEGVMESLRAGRPVRFPGFGTFSIVQRPEREGRSPATGRPIKIPPRKTARFRPGRAMEEKLS